MFHHPSDKMVSPIDKMATPLDMILEPWSQPNKVGFSFHIWEGIDLYEIETNGSFSILEKKMFKLLSIFMQLSLKGMFVIFCQ